MGLRAITDLVEHSRLEGYLPGKTNIPTSMVVDADGTIQDTNDPKTPFEGMIKELEGSGVISFYLPLLYVCVCKRPIVVGGGE